LGGGYDVIQNVIVEYDIIGPFTALLAALLYFTGEIQFNISCRLVRNVGVLHKILKNGHFAVLFLQ